MDKVDITILSLLQSNARYSLKYIASKVFLSTPAVSARIAKLENSGIIQGYTVKINREKLGYHIIAFINLELSANQKSKFYPFIEGCSNVLECDCVTGNYSMLLKVAFPTTEDLDDFIGVLQEFGNTSTQIVFSTPVERRDITIDDPQDGIDKDEKIPDIEDISDNIIE